MAEPDSPQHLVEGDAAADEVTVAFQRLGCGAAQGRVVEGNEQQRLQDGGLRAGAEDLEGALADAEGGDLVDDAGGHPVPQLDGPLDRPGPEDGGAARDRVRVAGRGQSEPAAGQSAHPRAVGLAVRGLLSVFLRSGSHLSIIAAYHSP